MEQKEKAKELIKKFEDFSLHFGIEIYETAQHNALICVDEIIKTKPIEKDYEDHEHRGREVWYNEKTDYWLNVKKEIEEISFEDWKNIES